MADVKVKVFVKGQSPLSFCGAFTAMEYLEFCDNFATAKRMVEKWMCEGEKENACSVLNEVHFLFKEGKVEYADVGVFGPPNHREFTQQCVFTIGGYFSESRRAKGSTKKAANAAAAELVLRFFASKEFSAMEETA